MCKIVKFRRVKDMVKLTETFAPLFCFQTHHVFCLSCLKHQGGFALYKPGVI